MRERLTRTPRITGRFFSYPVFKNLNLVVDNLCQLVDCVFLG
ncbi:unnamed protein product [Tenebrio molitor]|nr:unnamed protein product [Tenebrio molitor]